MMGLLAVSCDLPRCLKVSINPVLIHAGPVALYWYGLLIAVGFVIGVRLALSEAERLGVDPDQMLSAILVAALVGLLGARLYFVITQPGFYFDGKHFSDIFSLSTNGLAFYGGLVGAAAGIWLYASRFSLPAVRMLDIVALVAPVGQAIGSVGALINGDTSGTLTQNFGVAYTGDNNPFVAPTRIGQPAHPIPLYNAAYSLVLFGVLWLVSRRLKLRDGQLVGIYLGGVGLGQIVISIFSNAPLVLLGLREAQLGGVLLAVAGLAAYLAAARAPLGAAPQPTAETSN